MEEHIMNLQSALEEVSNIEVLFISGSFYSRLPDYKYEDLKETSIVSKMSFSLQGEFCAEELYDLISKMAHLNYKVTERKIFHQHGIKMQNAITNAIIFDTVSQRKIGGIEFFLGGEEQPLVKFIDETKKHKILQRVK